MNRSRQILALMWNAYTWVRNFVSNAHTLLGAPRISHAGHSIRHQKRQGPPQDPGVLGLRQVSSFLGTFFRKKKVICDLYNVQNIQYIRVLCNCSTTTAWSLPSEQSRGKDNMNQKKRRPKNELNPSNAWLSLSTAVALHVARQRQNGEIRNIHTWRSFSRS